MLPLRDDNPRRRTPIVTWLLIAANVALFAWELSLGASLPGWLDRAAFVPARLAGEGAAVADPQLGAALLSTFLHGGWLHIGGNMLYLFIFGDNVEDRLGHLRFAAFYLLCGLAATFAHALASPGSAVPVVGASGAIAGVLGAYLVLFPRARVRTLVWLGFYVEHVSVPALVFLPVWFLLQFVSGLASLGAGTSVEAGGVAWFAHVGGFLAGVALLLVLGGPRVRRPPSERPRGRPPGGGRNESAP